MYTVFQPLSDTRVFIYLFMSLFLPSSTSNRDRDCTFGLVSNMSTHHKQNIKFSGVIHCRLMESAGGLVTLLGPRLQWRVNLCTASLLGLFWCSG